MAREIVLPLMSAILEDAPIEVTFSSQRMRWTFSNGSSIQLAGLDGKNANRLRGRTCHLAIIDEAGFVDDLAYVVESILRPQLITTRGRMIMASTPPVSPAHAFHEYALQAEQAEAYDVCTIDDAEHISPEEREAAINEAGGRSNTTCQREYYCQFVVDEEFAVIPEFQALRKKIVVPLTRPSWVDTYVAADFGFSDLTVIVFAYLDFERGKLCIEDELVFKRKGGYEIGKAVKKKERELWGNAPRWRVADAPMQLIADMVTTADIAFAPAMKDDATAALDNLRTKITRLQIEIDPRCVTTIAHLHHGTWNKTRTSYARPGKGAGHYDGIDACKYLVRHVDWSKVPTVPLPTDPNVYVPPAARARHKRSKAGFAGGWR